MTIFSRSIVSQDRNQDRFSAGCRDQSCHHLSELQSEPTADDIPAAGWWESMGEPVRDAVFPVRQNLTVSNPLLPPRFLVHPQWVLREQPAFPPLLEQGNNGKYWSWECLQVDQAGPWHCLSCDLPDHRVVSAAPSTDLACANSQTKLRAGFVQGLVPGGMKGPKRRVTTGTWATLCHLPCKWALVHFSS